MTTINWLIQFKTDAALISCTKKQSLNMAEGLLCPLLIFWSLDWWNKLLFFMASATYNRKPSYKYLALTVNA